MNSSQIQRTSYFSYFESPNSCLQSQWFIVALAISSLVFLGAAAFGGTGLFASNLPQWLSHAVGTIGHSGCLAMLMWGSVLGGACAITAIILMVKKTSNLSTSRESIQTPNREPIRETEETLPNEESIETNRRDELNAMNSRLIDAARSGRREEVIVLLDQGANIEAKDLASSEALVQAAVRGHRDIVSALLDGTFGATPLIWAAMRGHIDVVTTLLDRGANIEAVDDGRWTPLMLAAAHGHDDVVRALLEHGANIEARDQFDQTPLLFAAKNGHINVVRTLLGQGANIDATNTIDDYESTQEVRQILLDWREAHTMLIDTLSLLSKNP